MARTDTEKNRAEQQDVRPEARPEEYAIGRLRKVVMRKRTAYR
jgi:hypothetical protein